MRHGSTVAPAKLRAEIAEAKVKVKVLMGQIRHREGKLRRIAADAFNEESEPIDGVTADVGEIVLGVKVCEVSAIGVCVYAEQVMSIPGQRESSAWRDKHGHATAEVIMKTWGPATHTDACLFCGTKGALEEDRMSTKLQRL